MAWRHRGRPLRARLSIYDPTTHGSGLARVGRRDGHTQPDWRWERWRLPWARAGCQRGNRSFNPAADDLHDVRFGLADRAVALPALARAGAATRDLAHRAARTTHPSGRKPRPPRLKPPRRKSPNAALRSRRSPKPSVSRRRKPSPPRRPKAMSSSRSVSLARAKPHGTSGAVSHRCRATCCAPSSSTTSPSSAIRALSSPPCAASFAPGLSHACPGTTSTQPICRRTSAGSGSRWPKASAMKCTPSSLTYRSPSAWIATPSGSASSSDEMMHKLAERLRPPSFKEGFEKITVVRVKGQPGTEPAAMLNDGDASAGETNTADGSNLASADTSHSSTGAAEHHDGDQAAPSLSQDAGISGTENTASTEAESPITS